MWRQGDVLMARINMIPPNAKRLSHLVLAEGERTGHRHRIEKSDSAALFEYEESLYLGVFANEVSVVHEEHGAITLGRGMYRIWMQREFVPHGSRQMAD